MLADCHLKDKYQVVFAPAESVLAEPSFPDKKKKTATPFHQSMPVCIKQIVAGKPSSAVVCCSKVSSTIKEKKRENCEIDQRQRYSRIFI